MGIPRLSGNLFCCGVLFRAYARKEKAMGKTLVWIVIAVILLVVWFLVVAPHTIPAFL